MKNLLSLYLLAFSLIISAQNPEKIIDDYYKSLGKNLDKVHSISQKGKMNMSGMDFAMDNYQNIDGRMYSKINMMGTEIIAVAFDGKEGYMFDNATFGYKKIPDSLKQGFKSKAGNIFGELYNYKNKDIQLEYLGVKKINDKEYQAVKAHFKEPLENNVNDIILYFDPKTHLLSYTEVTAEGNKVLIESKDYKNFDGYLFPTKIITTMGGQVITTITFDEIKINPPAPDPSIFKMPEN